MRPGIPKLKTMTLEEFKKAVLERPPDLSERLYSYGYSCGRKSVVNFEIIQQVFYTYNCSDRERLRYMRKILKGFRDGSSKR